MVQDRMPHPHAHFNQKNDTLRLLQQIQVSDGILVLGRQPRS